MSRWGVTGAWQEGAQDPAGFVQGYVKGMGWETKGLETSRQLKGEPRALETAGSPRGLDDKGIEVSRGRLGEGRERKSMKGEEASRPAQGAEGVT